MPDKQKCAGEGCHRDSEALTLYGGNLLCKVCLGIAKEAYAKRQRQETTTPEQRRKVDLFDGLEEQT